tara:strand:- start:619 stop:771 length:153 start_codon:yes stop_codon:yes gene_type:complete
LARGYAECIQRNQKGTGDKNMSSKGKSLSSVLAPVPREEINDKIAILEIK